MGKLTPKQEKFSNEFLIDLNGTQAAIRAGYSKKTACKIASENLRKPDIIDRINELRKKAQKKTGITIESVIEDIHKGVKIALAEEPTIISAVVKNKDGDSELITQTIKKTDLSNLFKGNELLLRHLGGFEKDNQQKEGENQVTIFKLPDNDR